MARPPPPHEPGSFGFLPAGFPAPPTAEEMRRIDVEMSKREREAREKDLWRSVCVAAVSSRTALDADGVIAFADEILTAYRDRFGVDSADESETPSDGATVVPLRR